MDSVHETHLLIKKYDGNNNVHYECRYCWVDLAHGAKELKQRCEPEDQAIRG